jgi:outer membrane lipoprotein SlyB
MKNVLAVSALLLAVASGNAMADDSGRSVTGALIGGAAGAALGHHIDGRKGAIVGSAIGAATGVAIANSDSRRRSDSDHGRDDYIYQDDDGYERERVVYVQPEVRERIVYVQPQPVVVYRPAPVVYQAAPVYYRPVRQVVRYEYRGRDRHDNGHHYGRDKKWKHGHYHRRGRDD